MNQRAEFFPAPLYVASFFKLQQEKKSQKLTRKHFHLFCVCLSPTCSPFRDIHGSQFFAHIKYAFFVVFVCVCVTFMHVVIVFIYSGFVHAHIRSTATATITTVKCLSNSILFLLKSIPFRACVFFGVIYKFVLKHFNNKPKNSLIRSLQTLPPPPPPATHKHGQVMHSISLFIEFSVKCFSLFRLINDFLEACCGCG